MPYIQCILMLSQTPLTWTLLPPNIQHLIWFIQKPRFIYKIFMAGKIQISVFNATFNEGFQSSIEMWCILAANHQGVYSTRPACPAASPPSTSPGTARPTSTWPVKTTVTAWGKHSVSFFFTGYQDNNFILKKCLLMILIVVWF